MHKRIRHELLGHWGRLIAGHPVIVLLLALGAATAAITLTVQKLDFVSDRNALLSKDLDWHKRYLDYLKKFEGYDKMVVVVAVPPGDSASHHAQAYAFVDHLTEKLEDNTEYFGEIDKGFDPNTENPILMRLEDMQDFNKHVFEIQLLQVALTFKSIPDAKVRVEPYQYLASDNGKGNLLFINIVAKQSPGTLDPFEPSVRAAQKILNEAKTLPDFKGIEAGLTGIPVLDATEADVATSDATYCSILAILAISALMIVSFGGIWLPAMAVGALLVGIAWSFGFLTASIGHLQMLSLFFTAMLLGLGVDFGIHLISKYELIRPNYPDGVDGFTEAMVETMQTTGPGIITGAMTTAIAFGTTMLTDFQGMAEMGQIAGVGILLCLLAMLAVLPAMMRLFKPNIADVAQTSKTVNLHQTGWLMPFSRHPKTTLIVVMLIVAGSAIAVPQTRFNNNLMELYPDNLEAVDWQERIQDDSDLDIWFGVSITDNLEDARRRVEAFRDLESVGSVRGIGEIFPADEKEKLEKLARLRKSVLPLLTNIEGWEKTIIGQKIPKALDGRPLRPQDLPLSAQREAMTADGAFFQIQVFPKYDIWQPENMEAFIDEVRTVDPEITGSPVQIYESGRLMQRAYLQAGILALLACLVLVFLDFQTIGITLARFGGLVLIVATFVAVIFWLIRHEHYWVGAGVTLISLTGLFAADPRGLTDSLMSMLPVSIGFITLFGVMKIFSVPINPANIIVLPLLFGIGVDAGVHIMHRHKIDPFARPLGLSAGTSKGILLTGASTIIGFGSLTLATHRGVRSLGFVLAMGIALTLLACMVVMPAMLEMFNRYAAWCRYKKLKAAA
jgi:predicted RND superfamily exporter protein